MPEVGLKELLEAGAHFGHQTRRWNPKMGPYLYGVKNKVHIIDLTKTVELIKEALKFAHDISTQGGQILFVGTKRQVRSIIRTQAEAIGMPYVAERWLGGFLTNWHTIKAQISRLKKTEAQLESGELEATYSKKELAGLRDEIAKTDRLLRGVKELSGLPAAVFVVDTNKEEIAVKEAIKLGIPVIAIVDSNADPTLVDYPIPANDDAIKTIQIITGAMAAAAAEGRSAYLAAQSDTPTPASTPSETLLPEVTKA